MARKSNRWDLEPNAATPRPHDFEDARGLADGEEDFEDEHEDDFEESNDTDEEEDDLDEE